MDIRKLQRVIVEGLEDVKAQDIVVFNTEHLSPLFERVVIATGASNRQTKALASSVREAVKAAGFQVMRMEGEDNAEWVIVDCASVVVHIMQPAIRQYYQLEEIWGEKPVAIKLKAARTGLVKASEPMDESESTAVQPKKAAGRTTAARKAATTAPVKKAAAKKVAAKKVASKKVAAKKVASKSAKPTVVQKVLVNAPEAKKAPARKVAVKKVAAKKVAAKKAAGKTVAAKPAAKAPARKSPVVKKVASKKAAAGRAPARKASR